jgi:hypothetical protein
LNYVSEGIIIFVEPYFTGTCGPTSISILLWISVRLNFENMDLVPTLFEVIAPQETGAKVARLGTSLLKAVETITRPERKFTNILES